MAYDDFWSAFDALPGARSLLSVLGYGSEDETTTPTTTGLDGEDAQFALRNMQNATPDAGYPDSGRPGVQGRNFNLGDAGTREAVLSGSRRVGRNDTVQNSRGSFSRSERPIAEYQDPGQRQRKEALSLEEQLQKVLTKNKMELLKAELTSKEGGEKLQAEVQKYLADRGLAGQQYVADRSLEGSQYGADRSLEGRKYEVDETGKQAGEQRDFMNIQNLRQTARMIAIAGRIDPTEENLLGIMRAISRGSDQANSPLAFGAKQGLKQAALTAFPTIGGMFR